ncbi:MAG: purine-binding chemotaxis protein [Euryarchaeota archaeon ADurb.Bin294]|nr:MAG: purine-binding chemotaxis protein [Euryarchaeota archaeon ADurb.Bin294]
MGTDEIQHSGRRGLFIVTDEEKSQQTNNKESPDNSEIIKTILSYEQGDLPQVPEEFTPVLLRMKQDAEELLNEKEKNVLLSKELDALKEEQVTIKKEHESYLNDLISAHTEFDRALEIFQYHSIPMVLLGPERQVMDANDIFCSIFSVERSEITRQFPPVSRYLPDEMPFVASDGNTYSIVSIKPPIVPFDHEAATLELLIPESPPEMQKGREILSREVLENTISSILLPVAIVDGYHTVRFVNNAFSENLARERQNILFRDIASAGFPGDINENIDEAFSAGSKIEFQTNISHLDNSSYPVWVQIIPLTSDDNPLALIVIFPDEEEQEPEREDKKASNIPDTILKTLIDLNPSPMVLFDEDLKVILANEGLSELIGVSSDQLQGQKLPDIGVMVYGLAKMAGDVELLPDNVCIESPFGMQCFSGILISNKEDAITQYILVLQPVIEPEPALDRPAIQELKGELKEKPEEEPIDEPEEEKSIQTEEDSVPADKNLLHFSEIALPGMIIEDSTIAETNPPFQEWSGVNEDKLSEFSQVLISHAVQSRENSGLTFSSLYPAGLKSYRIISQPVPASPDKIIHWFVDQTEEHESIAVLKSQIETLTSELTSAKNNLVEERSSMKNSEEVSGQIDIVEFELYDERYAMDIGMVREVVEMLPITPLPRTPPYIIGIINLRGEVTHVIDLAVLLGERIKKDRTGQKIIIVPPDAAHGDHIGIIVDNVRSVTGIGVRQVTALGNEVNERIQTKIKGIIKVSQDDLVERSEVEEKRADLVIWLDMKEILNQMAGLHK